MRNKNIRDDHLNYSKTLNYTIKLLNVRNLKGMYIKLNHSKPRKGEENKKGHESSKSLAEQFLRCLV